MFQKTILRKIVKKNKTTNAESMLLLDVHCYKLVGLK